MKDRSRRCVGIVLGATRIAESLVPIFGEIPSTLIPLNGKPSVFHVIRGFAELGVDEVYVSVGYKQERVIKYLEGLAFPGTQVTFVPVDIQANPGHALLEVVATVTSPLADTTLLVNLADTLLLNVGCMTLDHDFVLGSSHYEFSEFWCVCDRRADGTMGDLYDKEPGRDSHYALTGVYHFVQPDLLSRVRRKPELEISDVLEAYRSEGRPVRVDVVEDWYDLGHLSRYQDAKKRLMTARVFNSLQYNDTVGTITKRSQHQDKLINEIIWYRMIPEPLRALTPRVIHYSVCNDVYVELEYYGYPPLSELWIYGEMNARIWQVVLNRLMEVLSLFRSCRQQVPLRDYRLMYCDKTRERLAVAMDQSPVLAGLLRADEVVVNGRALRGWPAFEGLVAEQAEAVYDEGDNCVIHGDLCFSNTLYDLQNGVVRLIDPRGSWGEAMLAGDIKYDVAKLRHSLCGFYDFIVQDLATVTWEANEVQVQFPLVTDVHREVGQCFDALVARLWPLKHIRFIESQLFLSMIPMHSDNLRRQVAMLARGLTLLNEVATEGRPWENPALQRS